jgi:uncharacterized protein (TIGR00255 family)
MTVPSMTGFGRAHGELSDRFAASVVVRSVNHRYLDVQVRVNLREDLPEAESLVREVVGESIRRGRVMVSVNLERRAPGASRVLVDTGALGDLVEQLATVELPVSLERSLRLADLLEVPGVVTLAGETTALTDDEQLALRRIVGEAVEELVRMRDAEGLRLVEQIVTELGRLEEFVGWLEPRADAIRDRLLARLRERLDQLVGDEGVDEDRLLQEAALLADRADVAEELVRLRSHLETVHRRLERPEAVGRALDFLCQEILRELNTISSKLRETESGERLVDAKTAIERIREQVQNLE